MTRRAVAARSRQWWSSSLCFRLPALMGQIATASIPRAIDDEPRGSSTRVEPTPRSGAPSSRMKAAAGPAQRECYGAFRSMYLIVGGSFSTRKLTASSMSQGSDAACVSRATKRSLEKRSRPRTRVGTAVASWRCSQKPARPVTCAPLQWRRRGCSARSRTRNACWSMAGQSAIPLTGLTTSPASTIGSGSKHSTTGHADYWRSLNNLRPRARWRRSPLVPGGLAAMRTLPSRPRASR